MSFSRIKLAITSSVIVVGLSLSTTAFAFDVIKVTDKTPDKNPCLGALSDKDYKQFKTHINSFLTSDVLKGIDKAVKDKAGNKGVVPIEIWLEDLDAFKKQYVEDTNELDPAGTAEDAEHAFQEYTAYTYLTDKLENGVQVIRIKFFCRDRLRFTLYGNTEELGWKFFDLIVHEFTHATIYSMIALGVEQKDLPYQDHDEKFFKEVKKTLDELIQEFKAKGIIGLRPKTDFTGDQVEALAAAKPSAEPKILPDSSLYVLKDIARAIRHAATFTAVGDANLELKYSNERFEEMLALARRGDEQGFAKALNNFVKTQSQLGEKIIALTRDGKPGSYRLLSQLEEAVSLQNKRLVNTIQQNLISQQFISDLEKVALRLEEQANELARWSEAVPPLLPTKIRLPLSNFVRLPPIQLPTPAASAVTPPPPPAEIRELTFEDLRKDLREALNSISEQLKNYLIIVEPPPPISSCLLELKNDANERGDYSLTYSCSGASSPCRVEVKAYGPTGELSPAAKVTIDTRDGDRPRIQIEEAPDNFPKVMEVTSNEIKLNMGIVRAAEHVMFDAYNNLCPGSPIISHSPAIGSIGPASGTQPAEEGGFFKGQLGGGT